MKTHCHLRRVIIIYHIAIYLLTYFKLSVVSIYLLTLGGGRTYFKSYLWKSKTKSFMLVLVNAHNRQLLEAKTDSTH